MKKNNYHFLLQKIIKESQPDKNGVERTLEKQVLVALWETDLEQKIKKREAAFAAGFPVSTWVHWAMLQNDPSALDSWTAKPIDWTAEIQTPKGRENLLTFLLNEDLGDWLEMALSQGVSLNDKIWGSSLVSGDEIDSNKNKSNKTELKESHLKNPILLECCVLSSAVQCKKLVAETYFQTLTPSTIAEACLSFLLVEDDYQTKEHLKLETILHQKLDVRQMVRTSEGESPFLKAWVLENQSPEIWKGNTKNPTILNFLSSLDAYTLMDVFGDQQSPLNWYLNTKNPSMILKMEHLFYKWDNTLKEQGYFQNKSPLLEIFKFRFNDRYFDFDYLNRSIERGFAHSSPSQVSWKDWRELLVDTWNTFEDLDEPEDRIDVFELLFDSRFERYLDTNAWEIWQSYLPEIKAPFDKVNKENGWPIIMNKIEQERLGLLLATLPEDGVTPPARSSPRI